MTWYLNIIFNSIILAFCVWTVLDKRVHLKSVGTMLMGTVGIFSLLNMTRPDFFGLLPEHYALMLNGSIASAATWFYLQWEDPRKHDRRLFKDM